MNHNTIRIIRYGTVRSFCIYRYQCPLIVSSVLPAPSGDNLRERLLSAVMASVAVVSLSDIH